MSATFLFSFVIAYFLLLLGVAWYTSRNSNNDSFFIGNRSSNWMLVSFGMIGTSLSGVTFVSVPGTVGANSFWLFPGGDWLFHRLLCSGIYFIAIILPAASYFNLQLFVAAFWKYCVQNRCNVFYLFQECLVLLHVYIL